MKLSYTKLREKIATRALFSVAFLIFILIIFGPFMNKTVSAVAGVPKIINFQGRLMDSSGNLLGSSSGTDYCYRFGIWDVSTGGTANPNQIWPGSFATPTRMTISTRSGVFDASIGGAGGDTLDYNFQDNNTVYINVEVATKVGATCAAGDGAEAFETLDPRPQIVSSGYAINSGTVAGLTPASAATVSTVMSRDSNANSAINNLVQGFTTTATAGGTTTLAIGATYTQVFTGTLAQTVTLPTTSVIQGQQYFIVNQSTGAVTVQSSGLNTIVILAGGTSGLFTAVVATPTTAANWDFQYHSVKAASGKLGTFSNTLTFSGTDGSTLNIGTGGTLGTAAYTAASAYEVPLTISTGLTRATNTITANLSTGVAGGQTAIGGTGVTDVLSLKGTTGNGTLTSPAIQMLVGNDGATTAMTILNNGNVGIGDATPDGTLDIDSSVTTGVNFGITNTGVYTGTGLLSVVANSATTGVVGLMTADGLSSGNILSLTSNGTAGLTNQKGLNIALSGTNGTSAQTTYGAYISNAHAGTTSTNVGLYLNASNGTTANLGLNVDGGQVLIGGTTLTSGTLSKLNIVSSMATSGSTTSIAGIHGEYTFNPTAGGTQVGNRFVVNNAPTTSTNTAINQIVRTIDNTSLANTVRGIEIVSNAGSNVAGTNTGLRSTGATFGIQGLTSALGGGVSLPAAIYGESTGTTQGDVLRLYTGSMTSAPSIAQIYHDTSTFTGAALLMDMAVGASDDTKFTGNFLDFKERSIQRFKVTDQGVASMGLGATASTNAVCSSLANATAPTAGTAYEIRDCNAAPAADYAEMYPVERGVEFGDVVVTGTDTVDTYDTVGGNIDWSKIKGQITKLNKSQQSYQRNVVGIVSDNFGDFTSAGHNIKKEDNPMPVALNGRVPVKVSSSSGSIKPGDYLTTSDESGKATKATKAGIVIGKALETWTPGSSKPTVMVYIEQGYFNGESVNDFAGLTLNDSEENSAIILSKLLSNKTALQSSQFNISELLTDRIVAGLEIITPRLVASTIETTSLEVKENATFAGLTIMSGETVFTGKVTFDSEVEFNLAPVFNKDTAGFALIKEGDKYVDVVFDKPYAMTPVVTISMEFEATDNIDEITADNLFEQNITSLVVKKDTNGFTILLNKKAPQNIRFSWIALGVKDATLFESLGEGLEINSSTSSTPSAPTPDPQPEPQPETGQPSAETPETAPTPSPEIISSPEPEIISEPTPLPTPEPETVPEPSPEVSEEPSPESPADTTTTQ